MQLTSSKWHGVWIAVAVGCLLAPVLWRSAIGPVALTVIFALPVLAYLAMPVRTVAELRGPTLRIRGKSAPVADLLSVRVQTIRVNFIPVNRHMIFSFKPGEGDGLLTRAMGARKLALPLNNVAGGRRAAQEFAAQALAISNGRAVAPEPEPERGVADAPVRKSMATASGADEDGFDPDAIIARYLAERKAGAATPARAPARPTFGRKGL